MKIKKIMAVLVLAAGITTSIYADAKDEAMESIDSAKEMITAQDYAKAIEELNFAITKLNEMQSSKLLKYLPKELAGYKISGDGAKTVSNAILGANTTIATVEFEAPSQIKIEGSDEEYESSTITVNITVGGILGQAAAMANMYSVSDNKTTAVRIKGYKGNINFQKENNSGTLMLQIGEKITVTVEGSSILSGDLLKAAVEKMDLKALEKEFN